jgi:hypothetical protein
LLEEQEQVFVEVFPEVENSRVYVRPRELHDQRCVDQSQGDTMPMGMYRKLASPSGRAAGEGD